MRRSPDDQLKAHRGPIFHIPTASARIVGTYNIRV